MSTGPADPRPLLALLLLVCPALVACGGDAEPRDDGLGPVAEAITRTLDRRAAALRSADEERFLRTVDRSPRGFLAEQTTYFRNLAQLPVAAFDQRIEADTLTRDGDDYWVQVEVSLRLEAYDAAPVATVDRFRFTPAGGGRFRLSSTTDRSWEAGRVLHPQPWDLGPVQVRESAGVLGVFDAGSVSFADTVLDAVGRARYDVAAALEVDQPPPVVAYALADPRFAAGATGLPESTPPRLDAATLTVPADPDRPEGPVASYRVLLDPAVLAEDSTGLDRLVRHELTHVVLAGRGDGAPLWLTEGIAEYVSVRPMPSYQRRLPEGALDLARGVTGLPPDEVFAGEDAEGWYAVGWWICEHVAATYGESTLLALLDELDDGAPADRVLPRLLGVSPAELAERGVARMLRTYGAG